MKLVKIICSTLAVIMIQSSAFANENNTLNVKTSSGNVANISIKEFLTNLGNRLKVSNQNLRYNISLYSKDNQWFATISDISLTLDDKERKMSRNSVSNLCTAAGFGNPVRTSNSASLLPYNSFSIDSKGMFSGLVDNGGHYVESVTCLVQ